jgi:glutamate 5-kinase
MDGEKIGTLFRGAEKSLDGKRRWIAFNMEVLGRLVVDDGAQRALTNGKKSLLAAGISSHNGEFSQGDAVDIVNSSGRIIGRGIINYDSIEIGKIKGLKTDEIRALYEDTFYEEVIHRDNMIIF